MTANARMIHQFLEGTDTLRTGTYTGEWWTVPGWAVGHYCHFQVKINTYAASEPNFSFQGRLGEDYSGTILVAPMADGLSSNVPVLPQMRIQQTVAGAGDWAAWVGAEF